MSFEEFWTLYPKKTGKRAAEKSWQEKLSKQEQIDCISHLEKRVGSDLQWTVDKGKFIPMPTTFLNQGRWMDSYDTLRSEAFVKKSDAPTICSGCRSYESTQRHHDICITGDDYYDYKTRSEGRQTRAVL